MNGVDLPDTFSFTKENATQIPSVRLLLRLDGGKGGIFLGDDVSLAV